jgi:hypothetical protein
MVFPFLTFCHFRNPLQTPCGATTRNDLNSNGFAAWLRNLVLSEATSETPSDHLVPQGALGRAISPHTSGHRPQTPNVYWVLADVAQVRARCRLDARYQP